MKYKHKNDLPLDHLTHWVESHTRNNSFCYQNVYITPSFDANKDSYNYNIYDYPDGRTCLLTIGVLTVGVTETIKCTSLDIALKIKKLVDEYYLTPVERLLLAIPDKPEEEING